MADQIKFNFVDLDYQIDAVNSVVGIFKGQNKKTGDSIYRQAGKTEIAGRDIFRNPPIEIKYDRILKNLQNIQRENVHLLPDDELIEGYNFSVDMETGTGKTYVYLRTILELHKQYGFNKFIIVVPRIAILQGVKKSIEQLTETFKKIYDELDINKRSFIYNSKNTGELDTKFIQGNDLSIVIMNKDSFNKSGINIIQKETEGRRSLWELMEGVRPIIIIDEPQLIEGTDKRKSASLTALQQLRPLFTLRYSATLKKPYNTVYKLTSYDAYSQNLVKKIRVKTIYTEVPTDYPYIRYVKFTADLKAKIEIFFRSPNGIIKKQFDVLGGKSLYELSGNLQQYRNMFIAENPHKVDGLKISSEKYGQLTLFDSETGKSQWELKINNGGDIITLFPGDCTYNEILRGTDSLVTRYQISTAIKSHLDTQFKLLDAGKQIKAISLFFVNEVKNVRGENGEDGVFLKIFDEEYQKIIKSDTYAKYFKKYHKQFPEYKNVKQVREGYFAIDKKGGYAELKAKKNVKGLLTEEDYDSKSKEDIERGIELILKKKEELISFKEPLAFIFSHSALREGWDNPNVFTLCMLKESGSEMAKKQEIGRGLRLPVDINGNRCLDENLNKLTVIANANYEDFAENLQKDFDKQQGFDKNTVTDYELYKILKQSGIPEEKITKEQIKKLKEELKRKGVINSEGSINSKVNIQNITFENETLHEHEKAVKDAFIDVMREKGTKKIRIENGDLPEEENTRQSYMDEESFRQLLNELTIRLEKKTFYEIKIDSEKFIEDAGRRLNELLNKKSFISQTIIETTGNVVMNEKGNTEVSQESADYNTDDTPNYFYKKTDFEVIHDIMSETRLPRQAIYEILKNIDKDHKEYLKIQDILNKAVSELKTLITKCKCRGISCYRVIDNCTLADKGELYTPDTIDQETLQKLMSDESSTYEIYKTKAEKRRAINKYYRLDSKGEKEFAQNLDDNENVLLFTKLHKGKFVIDTPQGNYTPDWAVIYKHEDNTKKLYFIVETKIDKDDEDLTKVENCKIDCGKKHFDAVSKSLGKHVKYIKVKNYENFKETIKDDTSKK